MILARKWAPLKKIDDTLGVVHTHAVAGFLGGLLTGVFTMRKLAAEFATLLPSNGLIQGGIGQVGDVSERRFRFVSAVPSRAVFPDERFTMGEHVAECPSLQSFNGSSDGGGHVADV